MDDSDLIWQIKRGRPRKLLQEEYLRLNAFFQKSLTEGEHHYRKAKIIYLNNSYTLKIENLILKILSMLDLPNKVKHLPLLMIAQEGAKQMLISEMELIVFAIIIYKNKIAESNLHPQELIKICFFHSKLIMESDFELTQTIREHLRHEIIDFENKLASIFGTKIISLKKINKWSKRLKEWEIVTINYSYYVDSIILKAPPYKLLDKNDKNHKINSEPSIKTKRQLKRVPRKKFCKEKKNIDFGHLTPLTIKIPIIETIEKESFEPKFEREEDYWYPKQDNEYGLESLKFI